MSEVFVKLYEKRSNIINERHLFDYLFLLTRSKCTDYLRKKKVREKAETSFGLTAADFYIDPGEEERVYQYLYLNLALAIQRLPPRQRRIMELYYYEKKKTRLIASQMQMQEQTVRNHLNRAIVFMRKVLAI